MNALITAAGFKLSGAQQGAVLQAASEAEALLEAALSTVAAMKPFEPHELLLRGLLARLHSLNRTVMMIVNQEGLTDHQVTRAVLYGGAVITPGVH